MLHGKRTKARHSLSATSFSKSCASSLPSHTRPFSHPFQETDKASIDVEAQDDGILAKIIVRIFPFPHVHFSFLFQTPDGSKNIAVGTPIAIFAEEGDDLSSVAQMAAEAASPPPAPAQQQPSEPAPPAQSPPPPASAPQPQEAKPEIPKGDRIFASPIAKKIALEKGIPLANIKGTGPDGRIIREDVERYQPPAPSPSSAVSSATPASPDYIDIPVSNIRKVIGTRLTQSKQELPHYYLTVEINMDKVLKLRQVFNKTLEEKEKAAKLSVNDFILKAVACALKDVPEANSAWLGDVIRQYVQRFPIFPSNLTPCRYKNADISVAVATPTGLITPIVKDVGSKGLATISAEAKVLAKKARDGKLAPQEYQVSIALLFSFTRLLIHPEGRDLHCVQSWHVRY